MRYLALGIAVAMSSVLLLSAAGIYAMMSFTVTRRRREIGIRSALGAQPRRLLLAVFARASVQIGVGVATGLLLTAALELGTTGKLLTGNAFLLWPLTASVIAVVGVVAAIGPARRGLQIEPAEALRME